MLDARADIWDLALAPDAVKEVVEASQRKEVSTVPKGDTILLAGEIDQVKPEDLVLAEDRCYLNLPSGRKIELVREGDSWKVYSIFPAIEFR